FVIPTPAVGITVTQNQIGGAGSGDAVTFQIVVTNTGAATVLSLMVSDTLPGFVVNQATDQPTAMGPPSITQVGSGTRYEWSAMGLTFSPSGSYTFTITGTLGSVCVPSALSNTAFAVASAFCGQDAEISNPVGSDLLPAAPAGLVV